MSALIKRSITGLVFVVLLVGSLIFNAVSFFVLMTILIILGLWEFYSIANKEEIYPQKFFGIFIGLVVFIANYCYAQKLTDELIFIIIIPLFACIFIYELYRHIKSPFCNISYTIAGIVYIALPLSFFCFFVFKKQGYEIRYDYEIILGFFIITWIYDTIAYISGVSYGRHKLFKRISPLKSWEGFFTGAIFAVGTAFILSKYLTELNKVQWIIMASIIAITSTFGDLTESMLKRNVKIKDSGKMLPGHGGVLDRFDGVFLSAPFVFIYLQFLHILHP